MAEADDGSDSRVRPGTGAGIEESERGHPRLERLVDEAVAAEYETGKREETEAEAKRHLLVRVARMTAGVVILILGVIMLVVPGPGLLAIAVGLGLLAQDVPFAARLLENVRRRLPQDDDGKLPRSTIVMMVVVCVAAVAGSIAVTVWRMGNA
jgi:uncharacterized protein (TIGR02611 family)